MEARGMPERTTGGAYLRLAAAFAALAAAAVVALVVGGLVRGLPPIISGTASTPAPAAPASEPTPGSSSAFPSPPRGAVVLAKAAGVDPLGLALKRAGSKLELQASLVPTFEKPAPPSSASFELAGPGGRTTTVRAPASCGKGCYRATTAVTAPRRVTVVLPGHKPSRIAFAVPAGRPTDGTAIVSRATRKWLGLRSLVIHDSLGDGHVTLDTVWKIVAPDRIAYSISDGERSIIIGDRRWTKPAGSPKWITSAQSPVTQPQPFWQSAVDARVLGTVNVKGRPAWKVSFFDPKTPAWFTILVDKRTMHTLDVRMTANAHFMHDTYGSFDAPLTIEPPPAR
jgi:hypothetical protein